MIVTGYKGALSVNGDSDRVNVKADYVSDNAQLRLDDLIIDTSVEVLDELLIVLATLNHYAENLGFHEIER